MPIRKKKAVPGARVVPDLKVVLKSGIARNRKKWQDLLDALLSQPSYMYEDLRPGPYTLLRPADNECGVYHFFCVNGEQVESMYIGESHTGSTKWGLSNRIKQHLNKGGARTGNLAQKMVMAEVSEDRQAARDTIRAKFYVQFLVTPKPSDALLLEDYAISVLAPKYNLVVGDEEDEEEEEDQEQG